MLLKRDDFQLFFEKNFTDHSQFLKNVYTPRVNAMKIFLNTKKIDSDECTN